MRLAFDDAGRGDGVVLIHGHPFDRGLWGPQVTGLRDRFRVVTPDLRGFGGSPVTPHLVTMDTYAADIVELLDELRISQAAAPAAGAAAALRGRAERPDYRPLLAGLSLPAFVCAGTADPWSTQAVTAEIVSCLKFPEVTVFDGVGHLPNLEAEGEFNQALGDFLDRHAPGRATAELSARWSAIAVQLAALY